MADEYQKENKEAQEVNAEQKIVERVLKLKKQYENATQDSRTEFSEIYSTYTGKTDEILQTPYNTRDDVPKLRTEVSYIVPAIFSGEPEVEFEGIGDEDKAMSKVYEKIVNHRFQTIPQFYEKIESWVKQSTGFGTSEIKVLWRFETKKQKGVRQVPGEVDPMTGQPSMKEEEYEYEEPVVDEPDVDVPNHMDVYFNPIIASVKDQPCIIFRSVLPLEDVKNNPIYDYQNLDGELNREHLKDTGTKTDTYNSSILMNTDLPSAQQPATAGMVEIFELIDNDRIQTICGDKVLRDVENPYGFKNVVKLIFEPNVIPNRYEGYGVGQNTQGLGKMFYRLFNQMSTAVKLANNPMSVGTKGSVKNKEQLVSKPGGHVEVDTQGQPLDQVFRWQDVPDINQGMTNLIQMVDDEHKRASGATDLVQGAASNETLGQDKLAQANLSNRFELIVRRFKQALADVADMMLKMEIQNLQSPDAPILRIFPEEARADIYEMIISTKDDVKYNVRIKGETNVAKNKNLQAKRQVELFNLAQNFLTDKEKRAFLRSIAEEQGLKNIDELIGETNPLMEAQEQMQMQQTQMGMMSGMPGQEPMQNMMAGGVGDNAG